MPSPFPGMDPFLEGPNWLDFHNSFCIGLRAALTSRLVPRYVVRVEERLLIETDEGEARYVADVAIEEASELPLPERSGGGVALRPVVMTVRRFEPMRVVYLEVVDGRTQRVIAVIEVLSPWNKSAGGYGEYLLKRNDLLDGGINLLEIDLLRGGKRLPTIGRLPKGDYFAFASRGDEPKKVEVYAWGLRDSLPAVPVPLRIDEGSVTVPLQDVFDRVYDEAGYAYSANYGRPLAPPLSGADAEWVAERLRERATGARP